MEVTPVRRLTVTDQILDQLGNLIQSGQLKPGDKLPNERELAEMFGTTRARIREAFRALALIGLIETRPGAGSYVTTNHEIPNETLALMFYKERMMFEELYEVREIIERPIYQIAAQRLQPSDVSKLKEILDSCAGLLSLTPDPEKFLALINEFDRIIVLGMGNTVMAKLMDVFMSMKEQANLMLFRVPDSMRNSLTQRRNVLAAIEAKDSSKLKLALDQHYGSARRFFREDSDDEKDLVEPENNVVD